MDRLLFGGGGRLRQWGLGRIGMIGITISEREPRGPRSRAPNSLSCPLDGVVPTASNSSGRNHEMKLSRRSTTTRWRQQGRRASVALDSGGQVLLTHGDRSSRSRRRAFLPATLRQASSPSTRRRGHHAEADWLESRVTRQGPPETNGRSRLVLKGVGRIGRLEHELAPGAPPRGPQSGLSWSARSASSSE